MMSEIHYEQENENISDGHTFQKIQSSGLNRKAVNYAAKTSLTPLLRPLSTPMNKSSRKAFGNVSNVFSSKQSVNTQTLLKSQSLVKESVKLAEDSKSGSNVELKTTANENSKFNDEIESMFPNDEELMSVLDESITADIFTIDEKSSFEMEFDSDFNQSLVPSKNTDLNIDELF